MYSLIILPYAQQLLAKSRVVGMDYQSLFFLQMILQARRSHSPSLYTNAEAPNRTCSQRKPSHANGTIVVDEDESSSSEMQLISRQSGETLASSLPTTRNKFSVILFPIFVFAGEQMRCMQRRKPGSSLRKKPDLCQTPDLHLDPDSPGSSDVLIQVQI